MLPTLTLMAQAQGGFKGKLSMGQGAFKADTGRINRFVKSTLGKVSVGSNSILVPLELRNEAAQAISTSLKQEGLYILSSQSKRYDVVTPPKSSIVLQYSKSREGIESLMSFSVLIREPVTGIPQPLRDSRNRQVVIDLRG